MSSCGNFEFFEIFEFLNEKQGVGIFRIFEFFWDFSGTSEYLKFFGILIFQNFFEFFEIFLDFFRFFSNFLNCSEFLGLFRIFGMEIPEIPTP